MIAEGQVYQSGAVTLTVVAVVPKVNVVTYHLSTSEPWQCKGATLAAFEQKLADEGWSRVSPL